MMANIKKIKQIIVDSGLDKTAEQWLEWFNGDEIETVIEIPRHEAVLSIDPGELLTITSQDTEKINLVLDDTVEIDHLKNVFAAIDSTTTNTEASLEGKKQRSRKRSEIHGLDRVLIGHIQRALGEGK